MRSKNQSREKILQAATRLFHLKGYHATGISQILKESGAPKGSLYYYFPEGKEQLAIEAVERFGESIAKNIRENLALDDEISIIFQKHITSIALEFDEVETLSQRVDVLPIGLIATETALVNEALREKCQAIFNLWELLYKDRIIQAGYSEENALLLSRTLSALIEGGITLCLMNKSGEPLLEMIKILPVLFQK